MFDFFLVEARRCSFSENVRVSLSLQLKLLEKQMKPKGQSREIWMGASPIAYAGGPLACLGVRVPRAGEGRDGWGRGAGGAGRARRPGRRQLHICGPDHNCWESRPGDWRR